MAEIKPCGIAKAMIESTSLSQDKNSIIYIIAHVVELVDTLPWGGSGESLGSSSLPVSTISQIYSPFIPFKNLQ